MLIDASKTAPPARLETDVAIIGSGAAGLTLALALDRQGIKAVVVEAGGEAFDKAGQDFYRAASVEPAAHGPTNLYRRRAFGGTTAIWGGRCIPFDPIDFEHRPWVKHGEWPIGYDDVAAYYPKALEMCRAGPMLYTDREALPGSGSGMVDNVVSADVILDRIERFSEPTHFGRAYRQQIEASANLTILTGAPVTAITTDATGNVATGLEARAPDGSTITLVARRTVVAAGGIETPRLLLASRTAKGCGLGNERDLVGRFYQAHIEGQVGVIRFKVPPDKVRLDYERSPEGIYCRRYIWLSPEAQRRERLTGLVTRPNHANIVDPDHRDPVLSAMYLVKNFILPEYARKLTSSERQVRERFHGRQAALTAAHVRNIVAHPFKLAGFAQNWTRKRVLASRKLPSVVLPDPRNEYPLELNAEQVPNPDSRVMLGNETDPHGVPRIAVRWCMEEDDRARVGRGMDLIAKAFAPSGTAEIVLDRVDEQLASLTRVGGHHIGTARMGRTAETGVVDGNGAVFGTAGLYVAGAATFTTSSFANPTLTIVAMALRLADHLAGARP